ncbi:hypothetical protein CFN78_00210 [Amycolatopsis antarctica]|uniref:Uncharacterized protein n=1 Tax=Amycolatopsis antarctica TaxID=1854586 RepID=A0A263D9M6_9PSEU|nr:hypothetical protein [Amycolatopsis antarctica]OZM74708.1 hypothetical protein CFN78_00210 [Amycolatopsis antarctica]
MSRSVEVREFLLRCEDTGSNGVPSQRTSSGDASRISDDQVRRARLAVAHGAAGAQDCADLLDMLGLTPDDDGQSPVQR